MSDPLVQLKIKLAWQAIGRGDLAQAAQEVNEAIAAAGRTAALQALLAEIARREGRRNDAAALAEEVLEEFGPDPLALTVLGQVALQDQRPAEALDRLNEAYRINPGAYLAGLVIDALAGSKKTDEAAAFIADALGRFPADAWLLGRAARFYRYAGRIEDARRTLDALLAREPGNEWARRMQLELKSADRPAEALQSLLAVGERRFDPQLRGIYAKRLKSDGDMAGAAREFEEAARLDPGNDYWRRQAGFAYAKAGADDKAVQFLRPLFVADPSDRYVRNALFAAMKRASGAEEIVKAIDEALARHPDQMFLHGLRRKHAS